MLAGCSAETVVETWDSGQCRVPPAPAVSPCLCPGRCWACSRGTVGCRVPGGDGSSMKAESVRCTCVCNGAAGSW